MNRVKSHVKKGDSVVVTSGAHKGSSGKVLQVLPKKAQVFVEGVRIIKKHQKKSQDNPQGAIIQREGPIHISNVKFTEKVEKATKVAKPKTEKPKKKSAQ